MIYARFMEVVFERDGGAMRAVITVPYIDARTTSKEDAQKLARNQLVGDGWIAVKHKDLVHMNDVR